MGILIRRIAEAQANEDLMDLVITERKLLEKYGLIIQSEIDDLKVIDLVVQDMNENKCFQLENDLKDAERGNVPHEDIVEFVSNVILTIKEDIDNLLLVA